MIAATTRTAGRANRMPVMSSRTLDEEFGAEASFKCEDLQRTGAFKFRGAFNALLRFSTEQRAAGVATFSSGNHAQAIAPSACLLEIPTTIMMPADVPAMKIEATRSYGRQVVLCSRYAEGREQIGRDLAQRRGPTLILPYDHPDALAGQGTTAKELFEEIGPLDAFSTPLGDGGLLPGCTLTIRALAPAYRVYGVEPEADNDSQCSLRSGAIVHIDTLQALADSAQIQRLGNLTFLPVRRNVNDILTANGAELVDGIRFLTA